MSTHDLYHLAVIAFLLVTGALPSARIRERIACHLGQIASVGSRTKWRRVESNVAIAFGHTADVPCIARASFQDFWRELLCWTSPPVRGGVQIIGLEHLRGALGEGRGAILWESNGFGRRLLVKQILHSLGFAVRQIHGRNHLGGFLVDDGSSTWVRGALVKRFFDSRERRSVAEIVYLPASDSLAFTRHLHDRLRHNAVLCVSGDGRDGKHLVPLEFLGRTVMFSSGTVSLARLSGAPLLPIFCAPGEDAVMRLAIEPPIPIDPAAGRDEGLHRALSHYAALLEAHIRRQPGLYRNWHLLGEHLADEREPAA